MWKSSKLLLVSGSFVLGSFLSFLALPTPTVSAVPNPPYICDIPDPVPDWRAIILSSYPDADFDSIFSTYVFYQTLDTQWRFFYSTNGGSIYFQDISELGDGSDFVIQTDASEATLEFQLILNSEFDIAGGGSVTTYETNISCLGFGYNVAQYMSGMNVTIPDPWAEPTPPVDPPTTQLTDIQKISAVISFALGGLIVWQFRYRGDQ